MTIPPSDKKKIAVLLPLVIVPGIASTRPDNQAGDGEFDALERYLMDRSSVIDNRGGEYLGEGYRMRDQGYWTLSTLSYDRNRSTLAEGAEKLRDHVEAVISKTYASKVILLTHSYGGLIARKYIQAGAGRTRVSEFIQAQAPNTGAKWAEYGQLIGTIRGYQYQDMEPTYPHVRMDTITVKGVWSGDKRNLELLKLNDSDPPFPKEIPYTMIVSKSESTIWGERSVATSPNGGGVFRLRCSGDGFVPAFSQLGLLKDPNSNPDSPEQVLNDRTGSRVKALKDANIQVVWIDGSHVPKWDSVWKEFSKFLGLSDELPPESWTAYLEKEEVMSFLWCQRLGKEFGCDMR